MGNIENSKNARGKIMYIKDMRRIFLLAICLFVICAGCIGGKPAAEQATAASGNFKCEKFYEFVNKRMAVDMEEFDGIKESIAEELGLHIDKPYDILEISIIQKTFEKYNTTCNETIACNQKEYCISFKYSNGKVWQFIEF